MHRTALLSLLLLFACEEPRAEPVIVSPVGFGPSVTPPAAAPEQDLRAIDGAPFDRVARYFSGNYPNLMNHPAIHWTRGETEVVVSGRGTLERFDQSRIEDALARYERLLVDRGYTPEGQPAPPEHEPGALVAVSMSDLFPDEADARAAFTPEQMQVIRNVTPIAVWRHLAGRDGSANDRVVMYASSLGLSIVARDREDTIPMSESRRAFASFRAAMAPSSAGE